MKLSIAQQRAAAKEFAKEWANRGDEKQETQTFWITLLQSIFGITDPSFIAFELPVKLDHVSFIDGYIPATRVLIEQKGRDIDLRKGIKQSDGSLLTPFQQARRYAGYLPHDKNPRWIVVCNFKEFEIHDMNRPNDPPEKVMLSDLEKEYHRLNFLVDLGDEHIQKEMEISLQAGEIVGVIYDALLKQYKDPNSPETLKSLNALCVRLVFCLYAEDAGIFGGKSMFHDYLRDIPARGIREALRKLFKILDQKPERRDKYLADDNPALAAFPYVNGGLFSDEDIEIPPFTEDMKAILLSRASEGFNWSEISPTIFGAVFESTLNPETRRSGGMHYTSIQNIHKVIDPLFLDDLKAELEAIKAEPVQRTRRTKLLNFQQKLAGLTFLDPACGSGNFLTETYLSLRRLENEVLLLLNQGQVVLDVGDPIQVSISQFYGIEINDFAVSVAKTALWIAESQMLRETEGIVHTNIDPLPLKTNANIIEGNALRLDWEEIVSKYELSYIMGNPPFVGYAYQSPAQKADLQSLSVGMSKNIDYVAGWYFKTADYIKDTSIRAAFVSTNSITQGEQVASVWKPLYERFGIHIDFAHRTFRWDSEAEIKAHVHCVIVGFSNCLSTRQKVIYTENHAHTAQNINSYLLDAPDIFVERRAKPLCAVPAMNKGSQPTDGGNLLFTEAEYEDFIRREPRAAEYIHPFIGSEEFINGKKRYCLWLVGISPKELSAMPLVMQRIEKVREFRLASKKADTRKWADYPTLFTEIRQPDTDYIVVPRVSSERRRYVPMGFISYDVIASDSVHVIPQTSMYNFGVLISNVHMAWMRTVCGRLKSDYRYSNSIVYNTFPWPNPTDSQHAEIEKTAKAILDARAMYPDSSLANLYNELSMPPELRKAHQANDRAVMEAYGFPVGKMDEPACVAALMQLYQKLTDAQAT